MTSVAQRLCQKLLDLAIHGKLVSQNPKDEPAGELLARIRKARSAVGGRARTPAAPHPVTDDEKLFDLPKGWAWCRLEDVSESVADGDHQPPPQVEKGIPFLVISNVSKGVIDFEKTRYVPQEYFDELAAQRKPSAGDLLFTVTGSFGIVVRIDCEKPFCFQRHIALIKAVGGLADYLYAVLQTSFVRSQCDQVATGIAQKTVAISSLRSLVIPLPPLAEQKRIVEKLNAMLKEATRVAEGTERLALLRKKARAKILDLAIRGKLVKQEKSDEPASELLKRIATEKSKMVAEKKIKKEKPLPPIADDEIPFDLPKGWAWCRFRELGVLTGGHTPSMRNPKFWGGDVLWVTSKDMKRKYIDDTGSKITKLGAEGLIMLKPGAILMCTRSGILRRTFPVAVAAKELTINQDQRALSPFVLEMSEYVYTVLCALEPMILADYRKTGTTVESIIWEKFIDMPIPLPPLAEQRRIVAKVKEMLAACDALGGEG